MHFCSLRLHDFRNYENLDIQFSPRLNIFVGENGQGKTNILEAIYLLVNGDTFRFGEQSSLIRKGQDSAKISSKLMENDLDYQIDLMMSSSRKQFLLNGKKTSSAHVHGLFPTIIFSPESLNAIKAGAEVRRNLIDSALVLHHPSYFSLIKEYKHALKTRNRILKILSEGNSQNIQHDRQVLESIQPTFLRLAVQLTAARIRCLFDLENDFKKAHSDISKNDPVDIFVDYTISSRSARLWGVSEVALAIEKRAQELKDAEIAAGTSLVGPHKHEIQFISNEKDSRIYCSQGQQRTLILSFKIAQIVYHRRVHGKYPVLLLDDVMSELDLNKQRELISFVQEIQSQVFITSTDFAFPRNSIFGDSSVMFVENGRVRRSIE